jgi:hypothetical protein
MAYPEPVKPGNVHIKNHGCGGGFGEVTGVETLVVVAIIIRN